MRSKAGQTIFDYWTQLRDDRPAPLRSEFQPSALRNFLPDLFMLAIGPDGTLAFRLAGTRLCDLFQREFRGSSFSAFWREEESGAAMTIAQGVVRREQPAHLDLLARRGGEATHVLEMLLMPLRSDQGEASDRLLGALLPLHLLAAADMPLMELSVRTWTFIESPRSSTGRVPVDPKMQVITSFRGPSANGRGTSLE